MYLTKSDFKACCDCRTRLFYRKNHYPSVADENEYLRFLADGGFMVEFIAKARFPGGVDLAEMRDPVAASRRTAELLAGGDVTIFEAGVIYGTLHVRTDILRRVGDVLELIEVKSSAIKDDQDDATSLFLTKDGTGVQSRWREYLLDLAFQADVLQKAYPQYTVRSFLCVVNKGRQVGGAETLDQFRLVRSKADAKARPEVAYLGELDALRDSRLLTIRQVDKEVALLMEETRAKAAELAALIFDDRVLRVQEPIRDHYRLCRICEFRTEGERSGFAECWGKLAEAKPHILDLHRVGQIATGDMPDPVSALLARGRASILDLPEDSLGRENSYTVRRRIQWISLRDRVAEFLPDALRDELTAHFGSPGWPLHFIDFEACEVALPHHAGMRPYERVAFQWSAHTVDQAGGVRHGEWLNDRKEFPNFLFARSLRDWIGEEGTVYVWSPYEQVTLRKILEQIHGMLGEDPNLAIRLANFSTAAELAGLADWIDRLLGPKDARDKRVSHRIRDLHKTALTHYFHPRMGGRTSIKVVLPSVWESDERIRRNPCFVQYLAKDGDEHLLDPYKSLPALPFGDDDDADDAVREGTGAIRVYQDLIFSDDASVQDRQNRRQLLLQYCQLDTAAMVMIWAHWLGRYDLALVT